MKVTAIETHLVDTKGLTTQVFVRFMTDKDSVGYGEAGNAFASNLRKMRQDSSGEQRGAF